MPGMIVPPPASTVRMPIGIERSATGPTATIRFPLTITPPSRTGAAPVPSITVPLMINRSPQFPASSVSVATGHEVKLAATHVMPPAKRATALGLMMAYLPGDSV